MRYFYAVLAAAVLCGWVHASDTPDPPPIERRLTDLERRVALLEKAAASVTGKAVAPVVVPTVPAPTRTVQPAAVRQEWYTVPGVGPRVITVVPAGHHAHYDSRGGVVVHNNNQNGVPGAHAGLNPTRIAEAGQTIPGGAVVTGTRTYAAPVVVQTAPARFLNSFRALSGGGCPDGNCGRQGLFNR